MHSIYKGQLVQPAAIPHVMHMCMYTGGVAFPYSYPHPAKVLSLFQLESTPSNPWTQANHKTPVSNSVLLVTT